MGTRKQLLKQLKEAKSPSEVALIREKLKACDPTSSA